MPNSDIINEESIMLSPESLMRHPRNRTPQNIEPLAENIYANGLLTPLRVTEASFNGKHYIIAGERRWTAILSLRLQHPDDHRFDLIPCQLSHASSPLEIATEIIADNMDRENPNSEEFRRSVFALDEEYESASLLGNIDERKTKFIKRVLLTKDLSERQIRRYTSIVSRSIPEIKQAAEDGIIPLMVAEEISSLDPESQKYISEIIQNGGKVNSDLVSLYKKYKTEASINATKNVLYENTINSLESELEDTKKMLEDFMRQNGMRVKSKAKTPKNSTGIKDIKDPDLVQKATKIRAINKLSKQLLNTPGAMPTPDLQQTLLNTISMLFTVYKRYEES